MMPIVSATEGGADAKPQLSKGLVMIIENVLQCQSFGRRRGGYIELP